MVVPHLRLASCVLRGGDFWQLLFAIPFHWLSVLGYQSSLSVSAAATASPFATFPCPVACNFLPSCSVCSGEGSQDASVSQAPGPLSYIVLSLFLSVSLTLMFNSHLNILFALGFQDSFWPIILSNHVGLFEPHLLILLFVP